MDKLDELINDFRKSCNASRFQMTDDEFMAYINARSALRVEFERLQQELTALRELTRWVPVGERLPTMDTGVWVSDGKYREIGTLQQTSDDTRWWENDCHAEIKVLYWMPLPCPPELEEQIYFTPDHIANIAAGSAEFTKTALDLTQNPPYTQPPELEQ